MKNIKISLAGDLGSGKTTVGKLLAARLGAQIYSTGTIQRKIATEMGMTTLELNKYSETHPEIDDRIDDGLRALDKEETDVIIDSRMAWHFVPASFAVYMAADPVVSAKRIMNAGRESEPFSSLEEAVRSVGERRKSEMLRYEKLYGVNIKDLENYDYVIDTSFVSPETVAEHIAAHFEMHRKGEKFPRYELSLSRPRFLRVRRGMTLETIARAYCLPPRVLAAFNGLWGEPERGEVLLLPEGGNLYEVRGGETKALLSGSEQKFEEKNCTKRLYPTQKVLL